MDVDWTYPAQGLTQYDAPTPQLEPPRQTQESAPSYNMAENPRCIAEDNLHVLGGGKTGCPGSRSMEGNSDGHMFLM